MTKETRDRLNRADQMIFDKMSHELKLAFSKAPIPFIHVSEKMAGVFSMDLLLSDEERDIKDGRLIDIPYEEVKDEPKQLSQ